MTCKTIHWNGGDPSLEKKSSKDIRFDKEDKSTKYKRKKHSLSTYTIARFGAHLSDERWY